MPSVRSGQTVVPFFFKFFLLFLLSKSPYCRVSIRYIRKEGRFRGIFASDCEVTDCVCFEIFAL